MQKMIKDINLLFDNVADFEASTQLRFARLCKFRGLQLLLMRGKICIAFADAFKKRAHLDRHGGCTLLFGQSVHARWLDRRGPLLWLGVQHFGTDP